MPGNHFKKRLVNGGHLRGLRGCLEEIVESGHRRHVGNLEAFFKKRLHSLEGHFIVGEDKGIRNFLVALQELLEGGTDGTNALRS